MAIQPRAKAAAAASIGGSCSRRSSTAQQPCDAQVGGVMSRNDDRRNADVRAQAKVLAEQSSSVCAIVGRAHAMQVHNGEGCDNCSADGTVIRSSSGR